MNRIYQGSVSKIQIHDAEGILHNAPLGNPESCVLWQHHRIFQDAVNDYLVALGSAAVIVATHTGIGSAKAFGFACSAFHQFNANRHVRHLAV